MRTDDLSGLFAPNPKGAALPAQFRQAVLLAFDPNTGENAVGIGTSTLVNVPFLVTGAEIGLEGGDNILVMWLGNTAVIVAKIATPGSVNYGSSMSGRDGFVANATGWAVTTTTNTVITQTVSAPGWANSALLTMFGQCKTLNSNSTGSHALQCRVRMTDPVAGPAFSAQVGATTPNGAVGAANALFSDVVSVTPGATLTFTLEISDLFVISTDWPTDGGSSATITVQLQYFRERT